MNENTKSKIKAKNKLYQENQVYLTNSRINSVPLSEDLVIKIIRNLNVNKAHGHDDISIRMIKM